MASSNGRPFAVFDIDGTLIRWQLYHAIADALAASGHIDQKDYQTMRKARMAWKMRSDASFKDYEAKVIVVYESILQSLTFAQLDTAIDKVFEEYKDQVYTYTRDYLKKLKRDGYSLFAISGSQTEIIAKVADYYGFDDYVGTIYERSSEKFTGGKVIGSHRKDEVLKNLVRKHGLAYKDSIAIGDSLSDIPMLAMVKTPIVFNPEQALFDHAYTQGWRVVIERKNTIYELEKRDGKYQLVTSD